MPKSRMVLALGLLITIVAPAVLRPGVQDSVVEIKVDAAANRHKIDPRIYGMAYATPAQLRDLRVPTNRMGGNNTSRYNWKLNADNRANDWFFESIADASSAPGERGDTFVANAKSGGAE